jgi:hypothetical protein
MKDEKRKRRKVEQMEDSMVNVVNFMNGRSEVRTATRQRRGEAASNQGRKLASSKQASSRSEWTKFIEKMKKDCSLSRLEHGRSERHRVVNWKSL